MRAGMCTPCGARFGWHPALLEVRNLQAFWRPGTSFGMETIEMSADRNPAIGGIEASRTLSRAAMAPGIPPRSTADDVTAYVPRRLWVRRGDSPVGEVTDAECFALEGPLVILGDPGMGKSRIAQEFAADAHVFATDIWMKAPLHESPAEKTVIDGIDEVPICESARNGRNVIEELRNFRRANFALTCRSADWKDSTEGMIRRYWKKPPTVGRLLPLNEDEIGRLVLARLKDESAAAEFVKAARQRRVLDALGNPQNLIMLLDLVSKSGWPSSNSELYQSFCEMLATEANQIRNDAPEAERPSEEDILGGAGFVLAQLLLSGNSKIRVSEGAGESPSVRDFVSGDASAKLVRYCLGTRLFTADTNGTVQPCHRTVGEYLAARWLSGALRKQTLSEKEIDEVMQANGGMVPTANRGLHAWLATFCVRTDPDLADRLVGRDPYGFWCYGDPGLLGDTGAKKLLDRLIETSKENPRFYGYEGRALIGDWPRGGGVQDHIISLIEDKDTPTAMLMLLVDSIRDKEFSARVDSKLDAIVRDRDAPSGSRHSCLDCLASRRRGVDVEETVRHLVGQGDIESLSVAVDGIVSHTPRFTGTTIVDVLIAAGVQRHYLAMGQHGIEAKMTAEQLREGLAAVTRAIDGKVSKEERTEAKRWIARFLGKLLGMGKAPDPFEIWSLLRLSLRDQNLDCSWEEGSMKYFSGHVNERRTVQGLSIRSLDEHDRLIKLFRLGKLSQGLALGKEDLGFHLNSLGQTVQDGDAGLWRDLVIFGMASGFDEVTEAEVSRRSRERGLRGAIREIQELKAARSEQAVQVRGARVEEPVSEEITAYRRQFRENIAEVSRGDQLQLLMLAASAYLGISGLPGVAGETSIERLESFVGPEMLEDVTLGLERASTNGRHFKRARKLAETRARRSIQWYDLVLSAYCHLRASREQGLDHLGRDVAKSALAAHHLAHWRSPDEIHKRVIEMLEEIVYVNTAQKERHIRDITEPMLDAGETGIAGVHLLENSDSLSDVAGKIALGWLEERAEDLNGSNFWALLSTVCKRMGHEAAVGFVRKRIGGGRRANPALRGRLLGAAFLLDFAHHRRRLETFAEESRDHLWVFRDAMTNLGDGQNHGNMDARRCGFLLSSFAASWPKADYPGGMLVGDRNPWSATRFLAGMLEALRNDRSSDASKTLAKLALSDGIDGYLEDIKEAQATQLRLRFDADASVPSLRNVRSMLSREAIVSHRHLQAFVAGQLEALQLRVSHGSTDPARKYWHGKGPRLEGFCKSRIVEDLIAMDGMRDIGIVTEPVMADERRTDFLCTFGGPRRISVPIEVKCQWSRDLWGAAHSQLASYVENNRVGHTGIYLVLWFGEEVEPASRRVTAPKGGSRPRTAEELKEELDKSHRDIPYRLETFVLDLSGRSKPHRQKRTKAAKRRSRGADGRLAAAGSQTSGT